MLVDPLSVPPVNSITPGTAVSYVRLDTGLYRLSTSTLDEPWLLEVKNTLVPSGTSSFVVKASAAKNAPGNPSYGQKAVADDISSCHLVIRHTHRAHTASDIATLRNILGGFIFNTTIWNQFLGGER